jgi:hypothetical protein
LRSGRRGDRPQRVNEDSPGDRPGQNGVPEFGNRVAWLIGQGLAEEVGIERAPVAVDVPELLGDAVVGLREQRSAELGDATDDGDEVRIGEPRQLQHAVLEASGLQARVVAVRAASSSSHRSQSSTASTAISTRAGVDLVLYG